jgi:methylmalonyl-CoA/ethylmalonyl-CoA epimerase
MYKKVSHITMVVENLERTLKAYEGLLKLTPEGDDPVKEMPDARMAMISLGGIRVEFIEPDMTQESPFSRFFKEKGEGVFCYCVFVEDYDSHINHLKWQGALLEEIEQKDFFPDNPFRIAWVLPENGVGTRVELVDYDALPESEK